MKKTLVAIAALAAATGAMAQSTVTLYGTLDEGYGSFSSQLLGVTGAAGAKVTQKGVMSNNYDSSRWGFTALEDIGGGTKAGLQIESWIGGLPRANFGYGTNSAGMANGSGSSQAPTQSNKETFLNAGAGQTMDATSLGNRLAFVNLISGNHEIRVGTQSSFTRDIIVPFQADGSNNTGNLAANDATLTARYAQASYLYTGKGYGLGFGLSNNVRTQSDVNQINSATGFHLKATGANGPLEGGVAYSDVKSNTSTSASSVTTAQLNVPTVSALVNPTASPVTKVFAAAVSYDLQVAKLYGEYGSVKVTDATADAIGGTASTGATDNHTTKRYTYNGGVRVPFGATGSFVFAQYSKGKNGYLTGSTTAGAAGTEYIGAWTGYTVGVKHLLSKRTYGYVNFGQSKYDISDTVTLKANQLGAGLVHNF